LALLTLISMVRAASLIVFRLQKAEFEDGPVTMGEVGQ
jgi:hypothetical protein